MVLGPPADHVVSTASMARVLRIAEFMVFGAPGIGAVLPSHTKAVGQSRPLVRREETSVLPSAVAFGDQAVLHGELHARNDTSLLDEEDAKCAKLKHPGLECKLEVYKQGNCLGVPAEVLKNMCTWERDVLVKSKAFQSVKVKGYCASLVALPGFNDPTAQSETITTNAHGKDYCHTLRWDLREDCKGFTVKSRKAGRCELAECQKNYAKKKDLTHCLRPNCTSKDCCVHKETCDGFKCTSGLQVFMPEYICANLKCTLAECCM